MPFQVIPVTVPYRTGGERAPRTYSLRVDAVASSASAASAQAFVLAKAVATLRHHDITIEPLSEQALIGACGAEVNGPFAYVLTRDHQPVRHLSFPARIDSHSGEAMGSVFTKLDPHTIFGLVMDCQGLITINTAGLAAFAAHAKRLHLHPYRLSSQVRTVFDIVGLGQLLHFHDSLDTALAQLVSESSAAR